VKLLKTLALNRKHKTPLFTAITSHFCSKTPVDIRVSISTPQMKAPSDQFSRAPARALVRSAALNRSSSVQRIPASRSRTYTYDVNDVRTVTEGGYTSTFTTDTLGRVTAMTDGRGNVSYYEYDNRSRLTKATDPNGKITQLQYDGNGNITKVTDAANAITQYAYDPRNRLTSITDPFNVVEQWTWDNKGNLATYKDWRNKTTTFSYDALDRLSGTIYADATSTTFGYSYPAGGLAEMTMTEGTNTITRRFDNRDRLSYEVTPQGRIDYAYDAADRRTSMTVQNQTPISYAWDDGDRVTALTQGARSIALAYDQANRRSKITFPGTLEQRMTYAKPWGRPSAISYFSGTTPVQLDALTDATFDGDGRPISRTGAASNPTGLPTAFTASYTNNRLTTFNGAAWTYDTQGNLTGDGANTYVWDIRNRLIQIKQGATVTASFEYDALNRRTKKIIAAAATEYLHDGLTPVQEKRAADVTQLITGPGIDDYLSRVTTTTGATPTTTTRNYLTDFLGSTTALADDTGVIKTTYGYEPYGEANVSGEVTSNSFQYTGRENDGTGLMYYRARYYHPKAKRFISEDPIGQGGGINSYTYVNGRPVQNVDPTGLWSTEAHNRIIRAAFPKVPEVYLESIMEGSRDVDAFFNQLPGIGDEAEHAMRKEGESVSEAQARFCAFVDKNFAEFKRLENATRAHSRRYAYNRLGRALHAIMDSTSPAHEGFQVWHLSDSLSHGNFEYSIEDDKHLPAYLPKTLKRIKNLMAGGSACSCVN
jgi:RHS repeat-associated protein